MDTNTKIRNVIGSPFSGKTDLVKELRRLNLQFAEAQLATLPFGIVDEHDIRREVVKDAELLEAWRPSHHRHTEWLKLDKQLLEILQKKYEQGNSLIVSHYPLKIPTTELLLLNPTKTEFDIRIAFYAYNMGKLHANWTDRVKAYERWWLKAETKKWESIPNQAKNSKEAIDKILDSWNFWESHKEK